MQEPKEKVKSLDHRAMPNKYFSLVLFLILLAYGVGFLILGATLHYDGQEFRFYMAGRAAGSMLYTLFLGVVTVYCSGFSGIGKSGILSP